MALGDGRLMSGRSSLDEPTGSKKYSLAAPSSAEKAARRERKSNDLIDRNLQRAMRTGSPQQRIAAGKAYQERSSMPGYQQGGGIQSFEENQQRDRQTGDRFTAEGLRLAGEDPASVVEAQAGGVKKSNIGKSTANGGTGSNIGTAPADRSTATTTGALGNGSGSSAANARGALAESSTGGDWVNVGDGSTRPAETAPAVAPEVSEVGFAADRKLTLNANLARLKAKFEKENAAKELANQADSEDQAIGKNKKDKGSSTVANISEKYAGQGLQDGDLESYLASRGDGQITPEQEARNNSFEEQQKRTRAILAEADQARKTKTDSLPEKFKEIDSKTDQTIAMSEKAYEVAKKQTDDYFSDISRNLAYNASSGPIGRAFLNRRVDPEKPTPINQDTFDPNAPNMGQEQPIYKSVYGGPDDTYKSLGIDTDKDGNRNIKIRENLSYYGASTGTGFTRDSKGNLNLNPEKNIAAQKRQKTLIDITDNSSRLVASNERPL